MLDSVKNTIVNFFKGHERTVKAKKNIAYSFMIKGVSIVIGFIFVPLILGYLDPERYGIWLTLSSIVTWFTFFDIGLGGGLRNRLAESLAKNDIVLARTYVSTTYAILGVVFLSVLIIFWVVNPFLSWNKILNTTIIGNNELKQIALIVFTFFILRFFFKLIGIVLLADQRPAINNLFGPIGNVFSLAIIFILTKTTDGSLLYLSMVLSIVPVLVLILATILFYTKDYRQIAPSFKFIDFSKSKDLVVLGFKFFYFQIGRLIFFTTTNFLIAQFSSQADVAQYNVAHKYFFTAIMIYSIVLSPFWSAVTEAYAKKDFVWLKKSMHKLNLFSGVMSIFLLGLLFISKWVFEIWVGDKIEIPFNLSIIITVYVFLQLIVAPFSQFINGFGKLKLGLYIITIKLLIFIPTALILGKHYGAFGIVLAMAIIQLPSIFIEGTQTYKIINQKATGIWNK